MYQNQPGQTPPAGEGEVKDEKGDKEGKENKNKKKDDEEVQEGEVVS